MTYITLEEAKTFMWVTSTADDDLITSQIKRWESLINSLLSVNTLEEQTVDEVKDFVWSKYTMNLINPTALVDINWDSIIWSHRFVWRQLQLENSPSIWDMIWNTLTIKYTAGYSIIPDDVKNVLMAVTKVFYIDSKSGLINSSGSTLAGVTKFSQWELDVTYWSTSKNKDWVDITADEQATQTIKTWLKKYLKNNIFS